MSSVEREKYPFWNDPFKRALQEFESRPRLPSGLRSIHRNEALTYGVVLASRIDQGLTDDPERHTRRDAARQLFHLACDALYRELTNRDGSAWDFENSPVPGTQQWRVEQAQEEQMIALQRWLDA